MDKVRISVQLSVYSKKTMYYHMRETSLKPSDKIWKFPALSLTLREIKLNYKSTKRA